MPDISKQDPTGFDNIKVKKLHPTFAAEISGVDFANPVTDATFAEIQQAIAKVAYCPSSRHDCERQTWLTYT